MVFLFKKKLFFYFFFFTDFFALLPAGNFLYSPYKNATQMYIINAKKAMNAPAIKSPPVKYKNKIKATTNAMVYPILLVNTLPNFSKKVIILPFCWILPYYTTKKRYYKIKSVVKPYDTLQR